MKFTCFVNQHGSYEYQRHDQWMGCPKCQSVAAAGLCVRCETHKAIETVSQSVMAAIHGGGERICLCCWKKWSDEELEATQKGNRQLAERLEREGCN